MADPRSAVTRAADPQGADPQGADPQGADPQGADPRGAEPQETDAQRTEPAADPRGADPQGVADAVRAGMYARDRAAQALGITVEAIGPGFARCRMPVREDMVQGHATAHGGLIFTLADTAFAYACNACNRVTVALGAEIAFLAPARAGEVLCASARERIRSGRTGIYDVEVENAQGALIALFRGTSYETRGAVVAATGPEQA